MQRWTRLRALRMIGGLFALSLMLSACEPNDVLALLDGIAQEQADDTAAPEAPDKDRDPADKSDDDAAAPDKPDASDDEADKPATPKKPAAPDEPEAPAEDDDAATGDLSAVEQQIFEKLNAARADAGLAPLTLSAEIAAGARAYSCTMARTGRFQHADLRQAGVNGENIAYGYPDAAAVHQGWMNSDGHHDNRMSNRWSEYGVGVCEDADGTPYYTERFR